MEDGKGKWWEGLDPKDLYGPVHDINDDPLESKIQSDKKWINDDDAGIEYDGWVHRYIKGSGNYDNDLHVAKRLGATISMEICGNKLSIYAAKGPHYGALEIQIDGKFCGMARLYDKESMQCVKVYEKTLTPGKHKLVLVSAHASPANLDAIAVG